MTATPLTLSQKLAMLSEYKKLNKAYRDALLSLFKNQDEFGDEYAQSVIKTAKKNRDVMKKTLKSHGMLGSR